MGRRFETRFNGYGLGLSIFREDEWVVLSEGIEFDPDSELHPAPGQLHPTQGD